jgi:hypothetical protein
MAWFVPVTMMMAGLIYETYHLHRAIRPRSEVDHGMRAGVAGAASNGGVS